MRANSSFCAGSMRIFVVSVFLAVGLVATPLLSVAYAEAKTGNDIAWADVQLAEATQGDDVNDPLESLNRVIFQFNEAFQEALLKPVSVAYNTAVPQPVRSGVGNFLGNVSSPITLVNNILQGSMDNVMRTIARFMVNTVAGIGGISDVASSLGMEKHTEDFGQTLGFWGVPEGPYLVLPLFGPSNPRDAIGRFLVDGYFDAAGMWISNTDNSNLKWSRKGLDAVDTYAGVKDDLEEIKKTSVDYYAAIRSMYRQKRTSEINNGATGDLPPIPDLNYTMDGGPKAP